MRETGRREKIPTQEIYYLSSVLYKVLSGAYILPRTSEITKCVNYPLLHEGNSGKKITKNRSNGSKSCEPVSQCYENSQFTIRRWQNFATYEILQAATNFRSLAPFISSTLCFFFFLPVFDLQL